MSTTVNKTQVTRGQPVKVSARVSAPGASPTGNVAFIVDGRTVRELTLRSGRATLTLRLVEVGTHQVKVRYLGSATGADATSATRAVRVTT